MKATISDVARLAGVSTATVSHTINSTRYVSGETKEKVYQAIRQLGYTPYILAWVTFPEGVRIVAKVDFPAGQADELRPGQSLKVVCGRLRTLEDGTEIMGYKFKPVF